MCHCFAEAVLTTRAIHCFCETVAQQESPMREIRRPVRRDGGRKPMRLPYPYYDAIAHDAIARGKKQLWVVVPW